MGWTLLRRRGAGILAEPGQGPQTPPGGGGGGSDIKVGGLSQTDLNGFLLKLACAKLTRRSKGRGLVGRKAGQGERTPSSPPAHGA